MHNRNRHQLEQEFPTRERYRWLLQLLKNNTNQYSFSLCCSTDRQYKYRIAIDINLSTCSYMSIVFEKLTFDGHIKTVEQQAINTLAVDGWVVNLIQRGWVWVACGQSPPPCTKCIRLPINGQCTNFILFDVAL